MKTYPVNTEYALRSALWYQTRPIVRNRLDIKHNILLEKYEQTPKFESTRDTCERWEEYFDASCVRDMCTRVFSWAVPTPEVVARIKQYSPIVEVGAGTGYWAWLLREAGCEVEAWDHAPYYSGYCFGCWSPVIKMQTPEMLYRLGNRTEHTMLIVWPPQHGNFAYLAAKKFAGKRIIYIGEPCGGCTGTYEFFDYLDDNFKEPEVVKIPQWTFVNDAMFIYERR